MTTVPLTSEQQQRIESLFNAGLPVVLSLPGEPCPRHIRQADARALPLVDESVDLAMWSPPYYAMREYGEHPDEIGRPQSVNDYVKQIVEAATESMRCLKPNGSLFINVADRYVNRSRVRRSAHQPSLNAAADRPEWKETWAQASARGGVLTSQIAGVQEKSLALIPERIAVALSDAGFIIKAHNVWAKTHGIPDPQAGDRTAIRHEMVLHVTKQPNVQSTFDAGTLGSVFTCGPSAGRDGHPAPWPEALCEWIITNWSKPGDSVLDAFAGSGTTGEVARRLARTVELFDLYVENVDSCPAGGWVDGPITLTRPKLVPSYSAEHANKPWASATCESRAQDDGTFEVWLTDLVMA